MCIRDRGRGVYGFLYCIYVYILYIFFKTLELTLAGVAQLVGHHPANQKVTSSVTSQGTCLGCRFGPWLGRMQEDTNRYFSLTSMILSLSFSLPSPLSRINKRRKKTLGTASLAPIIYTKCPPYKLICTDSSYCQYNQPIRFTFC